MKKTDLSKKDQAELNKFIADGTKRMFDIRFAFAGAKPKNVKETMKIRKDIARAKTRLTALAKVA